MIIAAASQSSKSIMEQVGPNIIHHVSNTYSSDPNSFHPIIHIPYEIFGINFSVSKHVFMLWVVALIVGIAVIVPTRIFLRRGDQVPRGWMNALESIVQFIRDSIVRPNLGDKWVMTWSPVILTFFFFILFANGIGMVPIFDVLGAINRFVLGLSLIHI